jgi:hypothetical protein
MMPQTPATKPTANNLVTSTLCNVVMEGKSMDARIAIAATNGMKKMLLKNPRTSSGKYQSERFLLINANDA